MNKRLETSLLVIALALLGSCERTSTRRGDDPESGGAAGASPATENAGGAAGDSGTGGSGTGGSGTGGSGTGGSGTGGSGTGGSGSITTCGDSTITAGEECDDGNDQAKDGCNGACQAEPGWNCTGQPSKCADVDECAADSTLCGMRATCTNEPGGFRCDCNEGYVGDGSVCEEQCVATTRRCDGDTLQVCSADSTTFVTDQMCAAGLCDVLALECDVCIAGSVACANDSIQECNSTGQSLTTTNCPTTSPRCTAGMCVECLSDVDCGQAEVCRNNVCYAAVHPVGLEASYGSELTCDDVTTYFLALPPLEYDATLTSFGLDVSRAYTPYWGGMFALYASHPMQNVPFGDPIVMSYDWINGSAIVEPPLSAVTLQAGEVYWIGVDFGPRESGQSSPFVYPTATTQAGVQARTYLSMANGNINLQDGPTTITSAILPGFSGGSTTLFPSLYLIVQDIE